MVANAICENTIRRADYEPPSNRITTTAVMASPIGACYTALMTYNAISTIECLVEDFGWDAVMDVLMKEAAMAPDERLNKVEELLDAAIAVNEGKGL